YIDYRRDFLLRQKGRRQMIRHLLTVLGFAAGIGLGWTLESWHLGSALERCNASAELARTDRAEADATHWKDAFEAAERMRQRESAAASAAVRSLTAERLVAARA